MLVASIARTSGPAGKRKSSSESRESLPTVPSTEELPNIKHNGELPPEIWVEIFAWILESLNEPKLYCPIHGLTAPSYGMSVGNKKDWCSLRLVCRSWAEIAGPSRHVSLTDANSYIHTRIWSIDFSQIVGDRGETEFLRLMEIPSICPNLTSISLINARVVALQPTSQPTSTTITRVDRFLDSVHSFAMVRSLCLRFEERLEDSFHLWSRLQRGCPLLIDLAIYGWFSFRSTDEIIFNHLESFIFKPHIMWQTPVLRLPSIKHLAVLTNGFNLSQILKDYGTQLETLTIHTNLIEMEGQLWSYLPNILNLDISYSAINAIRAIPHAHPLRRLCIHSLSDINRQADVIRHSMEAFSWVPELRIADIVIYDSMEELISQIANENGANLTISARVEDPSPSYSKPRHKPAPVFSLWVTLLFIISLPFLAVVFFGEALFALLYSLLKDLCSPLLVFRRRRRGSQTNVAVENI